MDKIVFYLIVIIAIIVLKILNPFLSSFIDQQFGISIYSGDSYKLVSMIQSLIVVVPLSFGYGIYLVICHLFKKHGKRINDGKRK